MADPDAPLNPDIVSVDSYDTALCIIPPQHSWPSIDRIRALYDKSYEKWPPHINLIYPFVRPDCLPRAVELITNAGLSEFGEPKSRVSLDSAGAFPHKHSNTIFRCDGGQERTSRLRELHRRILRSLGHGHSDYQMHMTVAQSEDVNSDAHSFLLNKISLMPTVDWDVEKLYVLVRDTQPDSSSDKSQMKLWGTIELATGSNPRHTPPRSFYEPSGPASDPDAGAEAQTVKQDRLQTTRTHYFEDEMELWLPLQSRFTTGPDPPQQRFVVSSYNVLAEFEWPVSQARYPLIIKNIVSPRARADALVLQEITDDFLCFLLKDERVRDLYPYSTHGPPDQPDVDPLSSLLNTVVLSKYPFDWEWVSSPRKHKGSVVAKFRDIGKQDGEEFLPAVLATAHLTCGLTDGSVAAKKAELQGILRYLASRYAEHPLILAGDFNLSTSSLSVESALKRNTISLHTATSILPGIEKAIVEAGFADAWAVSRFELGNPSDGEYGPDGDDDPAEGEQGATYNPLVNEVAASIVGSGLNMRPQRYDRILVRGAGLLAVSRFNKFGFLKERLAGQLGAAPSFASDHWGVRCVLRIGAAETENLSAGLSDLVVPVDLRPAPENLSDPTALKSRLTALKVVPNEEEAESRQSTFDLLKRILLEESAGENIDSTSYHRSRASLIVVPVGSYGLGVWTASSDIDCLCIGPFSTSTFFALAAKRLRGAAGEGVKILRRVRASSGTMMELEVRGIKVDLQYCSATVIAENWPHVLAAPPSDPVWGLPVQTLYKLKAIRDINYLRRSVPDMSKFRLAHRFISAWARSRGILSAKFGFLSGIQISILLARVYKLLVIRGLSPDSSSGSSLDAPLAATSSPSLPDLLSTFFAHYTSFDWKTQIAFDPFFHRQRLPYTRHARDALAILGYFPPHLNTAQSASIPSVRVITQEFQRAAALIAQSTPDASPTTTWASLLRAQPAGSGGGADDFLRAHAVFARIDLQYWGLSPSRGARLAGWLESRCVGLLVDLARRAPGVHARIWPARFVEAPDGNDDDAAAAVDAKAGEREREYRGCYLIGLTAADDDDNGGKVADVASGTLRAVLARFEEQIRGDEKYFDARTSWVGVGVVERDGLGELVIDDRNWGDYTPGEEEEDEEEDEDESDGDGADAGLDTPAGGVEGAGGEGVAKRREKKGKKKGKGSLQGAATSLPIRTEPGKKFRTAADVMNRLRWDPELDTGDYVVGYEDRFVGTREKALEAWKSEQTDEEFIPQHRILYFKRRSDGAIIWDRRSRKDEIFGSGV